MTSESTQLPLRCCCGSMRGVAKGVRPARVVRLACYCRDCQTYAWFLERADELLDRHGGTEVAQLGPARVELSEGREHLRCVRLSAKGLMRWYAGCCNTPVGNTMSRPSVPFVGVISSFWDPSLEAGELDRRLGPLRARVNGPGHADADGTMAAIDRVPLGTIAHSLRVITGSWLRREHRPSPFFDDTTGEPRVEPRVLEPDERQGLRARLPGQ